MCLSFIFLNLSYANFIIYKYHECNTASFFWVEFSALDSSNVQSATAGLCRCLLSPYTKYYNNRFLYLARSTDSCKQKSKKKKTTNHELRNQLRNFCFCRSMCVVALTFVQWAQSRPMHRVDHVYCLAPIQGCRSIVACPTVNAIHSVTPPFYPNRPHRPCTCDNRIKSVRNSPAKRMIWILTQ